MGCPLLHYALINNKWRLVEPRNSRTKGSVEQPRRVVQSLTAGDPQIRNYSTYVGVRRIREQYLDRVSTRFGGRLQSTRLLVRIGLTREGKNFRFVAKGVHGRTFLP